VSAEPPDLDSPEQPIEGPATIFVSDPSAEADRLSTALRGKGYNVIDVPLSLLVARVAVQMPALILLDVDAEGALDEVGRVRAIPGAAGIDILFLGDAGSTLSQSSEALQRDGSGFLPRPVDVDALLQKTALLIGAQPSDTGNVTGISSMRPPATQERTSPSSRRRSPVPEPWSERPGPLPGADDALEPAFGTGVPSAPKLPLPALSPEIEKLLQGAEERSHEFGAPSHLPPSEPPSPDEEVDAVLPAEVLAALDEPLDENDDDLESDAGSSTSVPKKVTTGGPGATPSGASQVGTASGDNPSGPPPPRLPLLEPPGPQSSAPFSLLPSELGDPKEMETPRPPRRALASEPPMPNVPHPPAPPREFAAAGSRIGCGHRDRSATHQGVVAPRFDLDGASGAPEAAVFSSARGLGATGGRAFAARSERQARNGSAEVLDVAAGHLSRRLRPAASRYAASTRPRTPD
jgi:hypothetical protein